VVGGGGLVLRLAGDAEALYSAHRPGATRRGAALGTRVEEGDGDRKSARGEEKVVGAVSLRGVRACV
jgi:hypothetical protein